MRAIRALGRSAWVPRLRSSSTSSSSFVASCCLLRSPTSSVTLATLSNNASSAKAQYTRLYHGAAISRQPRRTLSTARTPQTEAESLAPSFAFAFDIDGVLLHVAQPIPGAAETLRYLHDHHVPFILLTNGGGKHEAERVRDLSARLGGVPLTTDNFVQSHTPFRQLVGGEGPWGGHGLGNKTVLVTGSDGEKARAIAEAYGFRSVVTPADLLAACPEVWPFDPLLGEVYRSTARPLPKPLYRPGGNSGSGSVSGSGQTTGNLEEALKIDAVLVFNDPRDWALDIQLILDLLLSRAGYLGTYSPLNGRADLANGGWQADGQPPLFFSNPDLLWSTTYHLPRLGQGAFQAALRGVWRRVTSGRELLHATVIGKPHAHTYAYAEGVLARHRAAVLRKGGAADAKLKTVYMVGDNPESDIAGANDFRSPAGTEWCSVLVRTGVWNPDRAGGGGGGGGGEKEMAHRPRAIVDDVREAVRWALRREGWKADGF